MNVAQRQEFCVRWNSHLGSIGAAFPQLLAGQRFVDVTLACEGHQVHCHRLVLAACSSYFDSILAENPCKHPVIILPSEIKLWEIQALVDFMYKGEVNVTQAGLPQLLRCAEQLRIRGLYGTDAALNLNQLKALTKVNAAGNATGIPANMANNMNQMASSNSENPETDDTATNSTTTTTSNSTASVIQQPHNSGANVSAVTETIIKKEPELLNCNNTNVQLQSLMQQQQQQHQQLQQQLHHPQSHQQQQQHNQQQQQQLQLHNQQQIHHQQQQREMVTGNSSTVNSNAPTEDDSNDDSNSNAYDQYEDYAAANNKAQQLMHMDSTIEDDHNYVAHDDDDSFGHGASSALDTEHETSGNASLLHSSMDGAGSYKRVRRSEASLAQAAKCVSKGQTFQTVSNMFNIPVSTIRFYMARKGILPKRKRGRGALQQSTTAMSTATALSNAVMTEALAQMKRAGGGSPTSLEAQYHLLAAAGAGNPAAGVYKMNEQQATTAAANII